MKKFILFFLLSISIIFCYCYGDFGSLIINNCDSGTYSVFCEDIMCVDEFEVITNGTVEICSGDISEYSEILSSATGKIYGECISITGDKEFLEIFMTKINFELKIFDAFGNKECYYGYVLGLDNDVYIYNEKINLQISYDNAENIIIIGTPIILGSF